MFDYAKHRNQKVQIEVCLQELYLDNPKATIELMELRCRNSILLSEQRTKTGKV